MLEYLLKILEKKDKKNKKFWTQKMQLMKILMSFYRNIRIFLKAV